MKKKEKEEQYPAQINDLKSKLLTETDSEELKKVIELFNLDIKKRNLIRADKLTELQDLISDQMLARLEKRAGEFSNKDLIDYFKVIGDSLTKTSVDSSDVPQINIVQNNHVNVAGPELSRESRERILDAIKATIKKLNTEPETVIDVEESEMETLSDEPSREL